MDRWRPTKGRKKKGGPHGKKRTILDQLRKKNTPSVLSFFLSSLQTYRSDPSLDNLDRRPFLIGHSCSLLSPSHNSETNPACSGTNPNFVYSPPTRARKLRSPTAYFHYADDLLLLPTEPPGCTRTRTSNFTPIRATKKLQFNPCSFFLTRHYTTPDNSDGSNSPSTNAVTLQTFPPIFSLPSIPLVSPFGLFSSNLLSISLTVKVAWQLDRRWLLGSCC